MKIPYSLLLPLLEHKFVHGERGIFRHTSYSVQEQFHTIVFIRAMSPAKVGWCFFFLDNHLISIKQLQFQIKKPPAPQLRTPNTVEINLLKSLGVYRWNKILISVCVIIQAHPFLIYKYSQQ